MNRFMSFSWPFSLISSIVFFFRLNFIRPDRIFIRLRLSIYLYYIINGTVARQPVRPIHLHTQFQRDNRDLVNSFLSDLLTQK